MLKDYSNVKGYIYKVTAPNNKIYIGQTINWYKRKKDYKNWRFKKQIKLWRSCQVHNWNPINTFEIIEECLCGENKFYLNEREIYWINFYDTYKIGLNCNEGGEGNLGHKHSEESLKRMSESHKKRFENMTDEEREQHRMINVGRKQSDEVVEGRAEKIRGIKRPDYVKEKISMGHKGKSLSEEHKQKLSEIKKGKTTWNKGIPCSNDKKEKLRQANLGKKLSPETIAKRNETRRLNKLTQESVEKK